MYRSDLWRAAIAAPSENAAAQRRHDEHAARTFAAMVQTVRDRERRIREIRGNISSPPRTDPGASERIM